MSKLFILGDIGYYNENLNKILKSIKKKINKNDLIIILGDNFYPIGIKDVNDKQIIEFKKMFCLFDNEIYMILLY